MFDTFYETVNAIASLKHAGYRIHQSVHSAWARRRYKDDFDRVSRFCLFVGYPRSGHSLIGALLNAHRNAVISHELDAPHLILDGCTRDVLYSRILARAYWFNLRGNTSNHAYQVPSQWQGRFTDLHLIGDKRGGAVTRCIAAHPDFLARVRALVTIPLRLIHVIRNPFDNISAISIWHQLSLEESIEYYFVHCQTTATLAGLCEAGELVTFYHEDLFRRPERALDDLCASLGLDPYPGYLEDCCSILFEAPTHTRRKHAWRPSLVRDVERRMRGYSLLDGYAFEITGDRG